MHAPLHGPLVWLCIFAISAAPGLADESTYSGAALRASKLIGMDIHTPDGKNVGQVSDLVFDASTGTLRYAAVTYGGFLGFGDKLFAVPFEAFELRRHPQDENGYILILQVSEKTLDGAVGFDDDDWPNFADKEFRRELNQRYNVEPERSPKRGINVPSPGTERLDLGSEGPRKEAPNGDGSNQD